MIQLFLQELEDDQRLAQETSATGSDASRPDTPMATILTSPSSSGCSVPRATRKKARIQDPSEELMKAATEKLLSTKERDEFQHYGISVGMQLKNINCKSPRQAILARKLIEDIICKAQFEELTTNTQVLSISVSSSFQDML